MMRLFAALLIMVLFIPERAVAAVAFGSSVSVTPSTGANTGASPSITTPASNPVVAVAIGWFSDTATVTGLTITGFGGTAAVVKTQEVVGGTNSQIAIWCIKSPTANTAGTVQGNFSASVPYHMVVSTFSGADGTAPCPTGDSTGNALSTTPTTITPTNLTANDASFGAAANGAGQDLGTPSPNSLYLNNNQQPDFAVGYATGTTGVTFSTDNSQVYGKAAIRIVAASAAESEGFWKRRTQ